MKIFLIGWFGAGNVGDEAILISELESMRKGLDPVEFHVLSFDPDRTGRLTRDIPEVRKIIRMGSKRNVLKSRFADILRAMREADVVMIGGGGLFQDIYNHYPIPFFTSMALLARMHRKPLVLYSLGIGPIRTSFGRYLSRLAAKSADIVSVRDSGSKKLLEGLGVRKKIEICADPAFLLEPVWNERCADIVSRIVNRSGGPVIGVCVQDLLAWGDEERKTLAGTLDSLADERGARIIFIPFGSYRDSWSKSEASVNVDTAASGKIAAMMEQDCDLIEEDLSPGEVLSVLGKMDLVISMRLHGLILGLAAGIPVVALTYEEETKLRGLMTRIDEEESLFDVRSLDGEKLGRRIGRLLDADEKAANGYRNGAAGLRGEIEMYNRGLFEIMRTSSPFVREGT